MTSSYVTRIQEDIYRYNNKNSIGKDHYVLLIDYFVPENNDFVSSKESNIIDVEKVLFEWYNNYDKTIASEVPVISEFDILNHLPMNFDYYIYLRILKLSKVNSDIEKIMNIICKKYNILPNNNKYLKGLILPFINYNKIISKLESNANLNLEMFIKHSNHGKIVEKILKLALNVKYENKFILENILIAYYRFFETEININSHVKLFLNENLKGITFEFIQSLLSVNCLSETIYTFLVKNMNVIQLTLYDINDLFEIFPTNIDFKMYNLNTTTNVFKNKYLPVLNLLKTKDVKLAHSFLLKGSVQLDQFNKLLVSSPDFFNNKNVEIMALFDRIPKDYMLKKLINVTNSNDPSIFTQEMIIEKFWNNFKQANTTSKTNRFLINCQEIALNNLDEFNNFANLINLVHVFPLHLKPYSILTSDIDSLVHILISEQGFNVIDCFNIIKRLNVILERHEEDNDEYLLLKCQSEFVNINNTENLAYLESTMHDFIDLLSEFTEYKCIFVNNKHLDTLWLRLIQYVKNNTEDEELFNKLIKLIPITGKNKKYLDLLLL
ncbi:hypothetical protein QEN19_004425 [Hanseniaspora menglaensis]